MTEKVESGLDLVVSYATKIEALMEKHSSEAWELALTAARVDAGQYLLYGFIALILMIICIYVSKCSSKRADIEAEKGKMDSGWVLICIIFCIAAIGCFVALIVNWGSLWVWAGIFKPELWLVHKILGLG